MPKERRHDMGVGGNCICPKCGKQLAHQRGVPCQDQRCPACGAKLLRAGSHHHKLSLAKQQEKAKKD